MTLILSKKNFEGTLMNTSTWFQVNSLILTLSETKFIQFSTKLTLVPLFVLTMKLTVLITRKAQASWASFYIGHCPSNCTLISCAKLKSACYIIRTLKSILSVNNLKMIYFSYIHSILIYGIIFGGNSTSSDEVFKFE